VNFTEIKPEKYNHKYLLVLVDTFSGIDRSFPHQMRDGLCNHQEDTGRNLPPIWNAQGNLVKGPTFVAKVSQGVAKYLEVNWKLHCIYRPQSSGQVE